MVDFDEFVVMKEGFLKKLNIAINKIIEEKQSMKLDYDFIEKVLKSMIKNGYVNNRSVSVASPVERSQLLSITLDFFNSIDPEFYKKTIEIILQQNKDIKMNIYNIHEVSDFKTRDENDFIEHTPYGVVQTKNGHVLVNIPTRAELKNEEEKIINKKDCTLEDLYRVVHEIAHLFDLNLDIGKTTKNEIVGEKETYEDNITRELTGEATAIAFEGLLSEYLLKNTNYPKVVIQQIINNRINSCLQKARNVYSRLLLAREKTEGGEITLDFIEKLMRDYNLSIQEVRHIASSIINSPKDMLMQNRYAIGGLLAPTIIKTYNTKGSEAIKRYLEEAEKCDLELALKQIGIQLNDEGVNEIIKNFQEYIQLHTLDIEGR